MGLNPQSLIITQSYKRLSGMGAVLVGGGRPKTVSRHKREPLTKSALRPDHPLVDIPFSHRIRHLANQIGHSSSLGHLKSKQTLPNRYELSLY